MEDTKDSYVPGVCNINRAEIAYRRKAGYVGLGISLILAIALFGLGVSRWYRLVLFVPLFIAAIGFLQAKNKFCVAYGANGKQNATEGSAKAREVSNQDAKATDKNRARTMNIQAALLALVGTAAAVILPVWR